MITRTEQNIAVACDVVIFTVRGGKLQLLLIQMTKPPYRARWACPGGLVQNHETLVTAAHRILREETNVKDIYLEQLYTFGNMKRDPSGRVVSVAYFALIDSTSIKLKTISKYAAVKWSPINQLPHLAYDHDDVVKYAHQRLKWKLEYTNVAYSLLPAEFPFRDLQKVYEAILGKDLDKRNFKKRMLSLGLIARINKQVRGAAHRPAYLYRFVRRQPVRVAS